MSVIVGKNTDFVLSGQENESNLSDGCLFFKNHDLIVSWNFEYLLFWSIESSKLIHRQTHTNGNTTVAKWDDDTILCACGTLNVTSLFSLDLRTFTKLKNFTYNARGGGWKKFGYIYQIVKLDDDRFLVSTYNDSLIVYSYSEADIPQTLVFRIRTSFDPGSHICRSVIREKTCFYFSTTDYYRHYRYCDPGGNACDERIRFYSKNFVKDKNQRDRIDDIFYFPNRLFPRHNIVPHNFKARVLCIENFFNPQIRKEVIAAGIMTNSNRVGDVIGLFDSETTQCLKLVENRRTEERCGAISMFYLPDSHIGVSRDGDIIEVINITNIRRARVCASVRFEDGLGAISGVRYCVLSNDENVSDILCIREDEQIGCIRICGLGMDNYQKKDLKDRIHFMFYEDDDGIIESDFMIRSGSFCLEIYKSLLYV